MFSAVGLGTKVAGAFALHGTANSAASAGAAAAGGPQLSATGVEPVWCPKVRACFSGLFGAKQVRRLYTLSSANPALEALKGCRHAPSCPLFGRS